MSAWSSNNLTRLLGPNYGVVREGTVQPTPDSHVLDLRMDGPYLAPTARALYHQHVVLIGGGIGVTPFMSVLSNQLDSLRLMTAKQRFRMASTIAFLWVTREFYDVAWLQDLISFMRDESKTYQLSEYLRVRIFVTRKLDLHTPEANLFNACIQLDSRDLAMSELNTECGPLCLGRPDWEAEFQAIGEDYEDNAISQVYVCGSRVFCNTVKAACEKEYDHGVSFMYNEELFGA